MQKQKRRLEAAKEKKKDKARRGREASLGRAYDLDYFQGRPKIHHLLSFCFLM